MSGELEPSVEFESGNSTDRISVQGRLKSHAKFWLDELDPSSFVKEIVSQGYPNIITKFIWYNTQ